MPRGRPVGTTKRNEAIAAAQAILRGEHADVRAAAVAYFHRHAGGAPRETIADNEKEGFRKFVEYVEAAYREILKDPLNIKSLRRAYGPLSKRSLNRSSQTRTTVKSLRDAINIDDMI